MSRLPCKDYLKGTCNNSFCARWHPPECLYYKTKSGCRFGEKCSYGHRQVDEQPSKRSKKNDDKSAVAMLKKNDWHENVRQPVVNRDNNHDRSGRPVVDQTNQKLTKTNKKETVIERGNPLSADSGRASSDVPEWLQEFRENLVDDRVS